MSDSDMVSVCLKICGIDSKKKHINSDTFSYQNKKEPSLIAQKRNCNTRTFANDFQHPAPLDGFNRILYVKLSDYPSPVYSCSEVADILKGAHDSPAVTSEICSRTSSFRGNLNRGSHSGWKNSLALFVKHSQFQPSRPVRRFPRYQYILQTR